MKKDKGFSQLGDIFQDRKEKKPPAYKWQDLALRIIEELNIPGFKRSSVFKVCKINSPEFIERCLNDTKELCEKGEKWKYFFKVISEESERLRSEGKDDKKDKTESKDKKT